MAKKKNKVESNNSEELRALIAEVVADNLDQGKAIKSIFRGNEHLFITGKAGCGKTTFMSKILPHLRDVAVVAPTGVAAINAGGVTIHSFLRVPFDPYIPEECESGLVAHLGSRGDSKFCANIRALKTLVIDEVSMVRADLLDKVSDILQSIRKTNKPFGGVRLIMFGDLNQLPPVITPKDHDIYYKFYDTPYFFSSIALRRAGFSMIEFNKVYRQNDPVFVDLLNNVRKGKMSDEDLELLNSRHVPVPKDFEAIRAVSHNQIAQQVNESMLQRLPGQVCSFQARVVGEPPKDPGCENILSLKVGCQVVLTVNSDGYVNGSLGIVHDIDIKERTVYVKIVDTGEICEVRPNVWDNKKYVYEDGSLSSMVVGSITQFPMKLGYALSIHKVQGMTFDRVVVDAGRSFTNGQVYVALSRCRTLENTYLTSPITNEQLIQDPDLIEFYERGEALGGVFPPEPYSEEIDVKEIDIFDEFGL